jgi:hypothetical protein
MAGNLPEAQMVAIHRVLMTLALGVSLLPGLAAADQGPAAWRHTFELYLMGPNLDGTVGLGPVDGDVAVDPGDVFDALDSAFLGTYIAEKEHWGFLVDLAYMDLEQDGAGPGGRVEYLVNVKQTVAGLVATYRLSETLQFTFGGRWVDVTNRLTLLGPVQERGAGVSENWFDPTVGLRYVRPVGERWVFNAAGDIGGLGVGSDLTWFLSANMAYRITERSQLYAGYRCIDFDYEDGEGSDRFKFDMAQHGFLAGFRFEF